MMAVVKVKCAGELTEPGPGPREVEDEGSDPRGPATCGSRGDKDIDAETIDAPVAAPADADGPLPLPTPALVPAKGSAALIEADVVVVLVGVTPTPLPPVLVRECEVVPLIIVVAVIAGEIGVGEATSAPAE